MPFVNPFLKIRCPYCREKFHPGDCAIVSTTNRGKVLRQAPTPGTMEYRKSRTWIEELTGPEYTAELARRECPHCGKLLFEGIETCENINIAIVGDTSSGKTHYIAVLIDQLKRGTLIQNGNGTVRLMHLNKYTSETYMDRYYRPILQERSVVPGTAKGMYDAAGKPIRSEPLVYQLAMDESSSGTRAINLLLYDISGEDVADHIALVQFGEHVLRADAIIYLADPFAMMNLRQQLPGHLQSSSPVTQRTAHEVLSTVMFRLEQYNKIRPGEEISIPTAIVLSKSDLLQYTIPRSEQPKFWLMYKPTYDGRAHIEHLKRIDQEVRYCLQMYGENALLQISRRFLDVSFFAISATGNAPDGNGKYSRIEPLRCLDPFIWVLWKLGYIQGIGVGYI